MKGKGKGKNCTPRAGEILKKGGYAAGGPVKPSMKKKCADGGPVSGAAPVDRLDKPKRSKAKSPKTEVNIIIAGKEEAPALPPMPPQGMMPPAPPPARPAGPPMGAPGMMPGKPPIMNRGGRAYARGGAVKDYPISDGSGGGKGRLQKAAAQKNSTKDRGGK